MASYNSLYEKLPIFEDFNPEVINSYWAPVSLENILKMYLRPDCSG